ncbi:MAG: YidC/Oxa1 family membrane protein insertase [Planctomycetota bacterium]
MGSRFLHVLLGLMLGGALGAAETPGVDAPPPVGDAPPVATPPAAADVEASDAGEVPAAAPALTFRRFEIENELAIVEISNWRAALGAFSLKGIHPIDLPDWRQGERRVDTDAPLAVLDLFSVGPEGGLARGTVTDLHGFLLGGEFMSTESGPSEGVWRLVAAEDAEGAAVDPATVLARLDGELAPGAPLRSVTLGSEDAAKGLVYRVTWTMLPDETTAHCEFTVANTGEATFSFQPQLIPINGIHQDDARNEPRYNAAVAHFDSAYTQAESGEFDSWSFPDASEPGSRKLIAHPDLEGQPVPAERLDYVGLRSRFFAAWYEPGQCQVISGQPAGEPGESDEPPTARRDTVFGDQPAVTPVDESAGGYQLKIQLRGFLQHLPLEEAQQAFIALQYFDADGRPFELAPGDTLALSYRITCTSLKSSALERLSSIEQKIEYTSGFYRFFRILAQILQFFLDMFYQVVRHYGVAIILLTILVKALLHRTNYKQQESMLKMQKLQPELKRIQERYKGDRQQLAVKQMELFKKHKVNPMAGCLPMFIQLPIFIALYQTFSHAADLRGTGFLWINDLTLPDQPFYLGFSIPLFGMATINPLPIIYIAVSLWMSFSHKPPANASDQQQQMAKVMRWLPVLFGFIFYHMPAGLVLYFTCSAIIGTLEIKYIRRKLGMS